MPTPCPEIVFEQLRAPESAAMSTLLDLYERAIPARERKSSAEVRDMTGSAAQHVEVARVDGAVIGFFLLFLGPSVALLEYMAVDEGRRGAGLGAALFARARLAAGERPLLIEVESDREASPDRELRRRRIGFYRRLGCRKVGGLDYLMPLPGEGPPPVMDLLVAGVADETAPGERVASWLAEIYAGVYGLDTGDPRLRAMADRLPPAVPLE